MRQYAIFFGLGLALCLIAPATSFAANEAGTVNASNPQASGHSEARKPESSKSGDERDIAVVVKPDMPTESDQTKAKANKVEPKVGRTKTPTTGQICNLIADNADKVLMNRDFFARLIWKESRFDIGAVSPVGAQGIAQFMPYTAKERGLADPYDYVAAIRHSALYLRDLKNELGNWGLAAAAYNGGINRMKGWIAGGARGTLPYETVEYVNAITYRPIEWFLETGRDVEKRPLDSKKPFMESCSDLPIMKTRSVFASTETPEVRRQPWGVQVAGHINRSVALKMFGRVRSQYDSVIGGKQPMVIRARAGGRAQIYAVRIGADNRDEASRVCGRLRQRGGSCMVVKN
ncbi:transglycosylase [Fulvimarina pelagi HTCC2506]|uniref:Transglycosylase n=2 Tax=Fulvimarina pelagi TaxID=217511 RepID=Q0FZD1_9HYPH|nr:transglycosylase [Fulvimarina pelagi HTCC2506]BAT31384.1 transglycosylase [Fulvimarina pelagi]